MVELDNESTRAKRRRQHLADDLFNTQTALHSEEDENAKLKNTRRRNTDRRRDGLTQKSIDVSDRLVRALKRGITDLREAIVGDHKR